jgi:hypothetical protein
MNMRTHIKNKEKTIVSSDYILVEKLNNSTKNNHRLNSEISQIAELFIIIFTLLPRHGRTFLHIVK